MTCKICNDTGMRPGSTFLDCSCDVATERAAMERDFPGISMSRPDECWAIHLRAVNLEATRQAARIAELERQIEQSEDLIAQTSHGAAERISDLERKVDAHRAEAHGLREAIFPRKIQDSKAWRVVPMSHLGGILQLIDPPPVEVDGQTMVFQNPHAAEVLRKISALVRAMLDEPLPEAAIPSAPAVEQDDDIDEDYSLRPVFEAEDKRQPAVERQIKLDDIEQYRCQMAGISTAALGYWKDGDSIHPDYDTIALRDVAKLYAKYDALYKAAEAAPQAADTDKVREEIMDIQPTTSNVDFRNGHYEACVAAAKIVANMAAQAPVREVPGWLPIETAPKDGSEVLLWLPAPYKRIAKVRWFDLWENWQEGEFPSDQDEYCGIGCQLPTHYMPLPAAPVQQEGA